MAWRSPNATDELLHGGADGEGSRVAGDELLRSCGRDSSCTATRPWTGSHATMVYEATARVSLPIFKFVGVIGDVPRHKTLSALGMPSILTGGLKFPSRQGT
ncbi:hypothetical protein ZWY2020_056018 [Hordeum vulgare]|nr:hypothetical protein ZWY2020_056018 [Hordeum vulgare]